MQKHRKMSPIILLLLCLFCPIKAQADKKGEGGIALEDTPIYLRSDSLDAASNLKKGQPVAAIRNIGLHLMGMGQYVFDEKNGRVQVFYFPGEETTRGKFYNGWVDPTKLARFYYDCSCGTKKEDCDPIETRGFRLSFMWNSCFNEAWERKASDLEAKTAGGQSTISKESVEERLKKLEELLKKGMITKEEYAKKRAEILNSI